MTTVARTSSTFPPDIFINTADNAAIPGKITAATSGRGHPRQGAWPIRTRLQNTSGRLPQELVKTGMTNRNEANRYLEKTYMKQHYAKFAVPTTAEGTAIILYSIHPRRLAGNTVRAV